MDDLIQLIETEGDQVALIMFAGLLVFNVSMF